MNEDAFPQVPVRTPETDEVLRRVGRNLVIFQQVEQLLKLLNSHAQVSGPASEMAALLEKQVAAQAKETLGTQAGKLMHGFLRTQTEQESPNQIDEIWFSFRFTSGSDAAFLDRHDQEMQALVAARNELVHHFLPRWQSAVRGNSASVLADLDAQRADAVQMLERLKAWVISLDTGRQQLAAFMASPEFERQMELDFVQGSRLVAMLGDIAMRTARPDGWAFLSTAGSLIKREAPTELDDLPQRFGVRNLKGVLLASELFDVIDEPMPSGVARVIYRVKDRYELRLKGEQGAVELRG